MTVDPPLPKGVPLNALRAFEAAARLGGFSAAAAELGVSPSAVTAHLKALEASLGVVLFARTVRGVRLTAAGEAAGPRLTRAFAALGRVVEDLRAEGSATVMQIATLPALAQLWLTPRLPDLRAAIPEVTLSVTAMEAPPEAKRGSFDLHLFYGPDGRGRLCDDVILPVCAPAMAARLSGPQDLPAVPALSDSAWAADWAAWAAVAMPGQGFVPRGPVHSLYAVALAEALGGAGVLMGHAALVAAALARGDLVCPFGPAVTLPRTLCLTHPRPPTRTVRRVAAWLAASVQPAEAGIGLVPRS